ncbi:MAG: class I SAM-dependent methyltransferase [Steroidobacteraceae bacterium]
MNALESDTVRQTLGKPAVHRQWIDHYYHAESPLYEAAFNRIIALLAPHRTATFLDAGCGDATQTIRLARRGYRVVALDFSQYVLGEARKKVAGCGLDDRVRIEHGSLLRLPFADGAFEYVLCWGVLMHIPELETAIAELARVVRPNGFVIVSENNMWSVEALLVRIARRLCGRSLVGRLRGKEPARLRVTPAGAEYWRQTDAGPLICREARVPWLIAKFASHGLALRARMPGAFIERDAELPTRQLRHWTRRLNLAWFNHVRLPGPASANILLLQRIRSSASRSG